MSEKLNYNDDLEKVLTAIFGPFYVDRTTTKPLSWWQKLFLLTGVIAWWVVIGFFILKIKKFSIL